eukprot:COSAG02_NODE_820_length_16798_cov_10.212887_9_plen_87_part_00
MLVKVIGFHFQIDKWHDDGRIQQARLPALTPGSQNQYRWGENLFNFPQCVLENTTILCGLFQRVRSSQGVGTVGMGMAMVMMGLGC